MTRNQFDSNVTWVRIPPSAPKAAPCGVLLFIFATNFARAQETPTVCAKYHYSISHWVVIFYCRFAKFRCFFIGIFPLFSSSDFRVRYKSYQQSRQIAIHEIAQKSVFPFCIALYFAHKNTNHLCRMGSLDFLYHIRYNSIEI